MFDKMVFSAKIEDKDIPQLVKTLHLQRCTEGIEEFYQSSSYGNFDGLYIRIKRGAIQIKCSLHKIYYKETFGRLDNSQMFTVNNALTMIILLFDSLRMDRRKIKVTYYEIGLNLQVNNDPLGYIELMTFAGVGKEMFNDANFQKNRQRTSEKSKNIKKVLKAYDKGFEARSKGRNVSGNILRLETIYRRQSIPLLTLTSYDYLVKLTSRFYRDWHNVEFPRKVCADKGIKSSQIEKAQSIILLGREEYLKQNRQAYLSGSLTKKQWETIRLFVRGWDSIKDRFRFPPSDMEMEYKKTLLETYQIATF